MTDVRRKHYEPLRKRFDTQEPGLLGAWDGRKRPPLPASAKPHQQPSQPVLSAEEFSALTPEEKLHLSNEGKLPQ